MTTSRDKDQEMISESLGAIAEAVMRLEQRNDVFVKKIDAVLDDSGKAHTDQKQELVEILHLYKKQTEMQTELSKALVSFMERVEKSGFLTIVSNAKLFMRWILVVISTGLVWIGFNMSLEWYVKVVQPRAQHVPSQMLPSYAPQPETPAMPEKKNEPAQKNKR